MVKGIPGGDGPRSCAYEPKGAPHLRKKIEIVKKCPADVFGSP